MKPLLVVDGLCRNFGGLRAVRDVSFQVGKGEVIGLIGPNGAGKSTTFSIVSGTLAPSSGSVVFKGVNTVGMRPNRIVRLGLVRTFQATVIYLRATVIENVRRGAFLRAQEKFWASLLGSQTLSSEQSDRVAATLDLLSLTPYSDRVAGTLPYGFQRRLGIAIALASEPELLLLDEPAAGLNEVEAAELGRVILRVREERGTTVLLVEHHMRLVMETCERILVLDHGEMIAQGTPSDIKADPKVIDAYLGAAEDIEHA